MDVHIPCNTRQLHQGRQLTGAPTSQIRGGPGAALKAVGYIRGVPRMTGPPALFWASLSGWLLLYWFR